MLLIAASSLVVHPPAVTVLSKATVTIERPAKASREEWNRAPATSRHEKIVRDASGRLLLMRIVDFE